MAMRSKAVLIIMTIVCIITVAYFFLSLSFTRHNLFITMEQDLSLARDIADDMVSTTVLLLVSDATTVTERLLKADTDMEMMSFMEAQLAEFPKFNTFTIYDRNGKDIKCGEPCIHDEKHNDNLKIAFNGRTVISSTQYNEVGLLVIHIYLPMGQDRVLSASFSGMIFTSLLAKYRLWHTGSIFMVDNTGTIVAHYRADLVLDQRNYVNDAKTNAEEEALGAFFRHVITNGDGVGFYPFEGKEYFCSYKKVSNPDTDWHIAVAVPINESPLDILRTGLLLSGLCFLGLGLILSLIISRYVVQPYYKIEEQNHILADLNEKVINASKAKSDFLANMSHEMRTPLNAVIGLSELTLGNGTLNGENLTNLEKISNAGMTLLSTVNDILDISKIEAGKFELVPVEYDTPSMLNDTITQNLMRIGEKPVKFCLDIDENLPTRLRGDDLRVKQIINNILSNAFKYTKEGVVELNVSCEPDGAAIWMIVSIRDTGIGIREEHLDNLFSDYAQVDTSSNRKIEGTGLGLSITKRIVEMMGGSVTVESEYGKGSVFTARFRQQSINGAVIGPEVVHCLKNFHYSDQKRSKNNKMARVALPYAHVLVVDDVATNLDVARGMMKPYGMHIDCVSSGQEAVDIVRAAKVRYNGIFMDHMMPEMDGIEATRIIREEIGTEYARTVPIIALTANAIVGNEEMFLSKGFQAFLSKPIEIERLDSVIREWVRDKELEKSFNNKKFAVDGHEYLDGRSGRERRARSERRICIGRRAFDKKVKGIDYGKGIERFGGDEESFMQVLESYAVNTGPLLDKAREVNRDSLAGYAVAVHGIKGSSWGICAEQLGAKAEALEKAAKDGNMDFVTANNNAMIETAEELIKSIQDILREIKLENPKPKKDRPDIDLLNRLETACRAYDMDGVDAVMEEISEFEYEADNGLAVWLKENVDQMNFEQIVEKLSEESNG